MYKSSLGLIFFLLLSKSLLGGVYEKNCLACHKRLPVGIDKFFYHYLLVHSSQGEVKKALKEYLKNPQKEKSLVADGLLRRFGIKKPTKLNEKQLNEALDTYWEKYNLIGKLE